MPCWENAVCLLVLELTMPMSSPRGTFGSPCAKLFASEVVKKVRCLVPFCCDSLLAVLTYYHDLLYIWSFVTKPLPYHCSRFPFTVEPVAILLSPSAMLVDAEHNGMTSLCQTNQNNGNITLPMVLLWIMWYGTPLLLCNRILTGGYYRHKNQKNKI